MARYNEIARDLARGKPQPIFDVDERNGDVLWEFWIDGFAQAMELRPDSWAALTDSGDSEAADALSRMTRLIAVACNESDRDSVQINALQDQAAADLVDAVVRLYAARMRNGGASPISRGARPVKVGRNEPCSCGSGKKSKRCCG